MSYIFALSSPQSACSLRSATSSRSNSVSSISSTSSSYSRSSSITPLTPVPPKTSSESKTKTKANSSFFHHTSLSAKPPPASPSIVDTKKEAREAREARNRAIRLREQLLRETMLEDDSSTPGERRGKREEGYRWKMHYEIMDETRKMMEQKTRLRR